MTNGNEPAYPISEEMTDRLIAGIQIYTGLTKREHFAACAIAAHSALIESGYPVEGTAKQCVLLADAIIKALNQPQP